MLFSGFGTSLCWWANIDYPDHLKEQLVELIFGESGLGMNIARYNIGGGYNPNIKQNMRLGGLMNSIIDEKGTIDILRDKNQKSIMDIALTKKLNKIELFINSPPWWMTKSEKTNGANEIFTNNLRDDKIEDFSQYIVDIYNYMISLYGNKIVSVEPFNEPSNPFWVSTFNQEGCFFDYIIRNQILNTVYSKQKDIPIVAYDEFSPGFAILGYILSEKRMIRRWNIHSYAFRWRNFNFYLDDLDITRFILRKLIQNEIWMTEYGLGGVDDMKNSLQLAKQIIRDLRTLTPSAWIYWQVIENTTPNGWGLIHINFGDPKIIIIRKQYWIMKHFTKYLQENDQYIKPTGNDELYILKQNGKRSYIRINRSNMFVELNKTICKTAYNIRYTTDRMDYVHLENIKTIEPHSIISFNY